ncbi:hypothetical protein MASR2M15_04310 [Anaerolineales bacterium]
MPVGICALIAWLAFFIIGETPLVRSAGLAAAIAGVTLTLRRMGTVVAVIGGLTLAFTPAFWSQTGGRISEPATIVIALGLASAIALFALILSKRPIIGFSLGVIIFVFLFWSQIGTERSLRLTGFATSWLLFFLVDMLMLTNPRPEDDAPRKAHPYHLIGIIILLGTGVLNDPVMAFLIPAVCIALFLNRTTLHPVYIIGLIIISLLGVYGLYTNYWLQGYLDLMAWREASYWIELIQIVVRQFTIVGVILSVIGLARLARWYPVLGITSMIAYGAYIFFGLIYTGPNREILLLPIYIVQTIWLSYAIVALASWLDKTLSHKIPFIQYAASLAYVILPLTLFGQILGFRI